MVPWLPLYLLAVVALTLFPFSSPSCPETGWKLALEGRDVVANVVLFLPLGLAMRRTGALRTALFALGLSLAIEIAQQWLPREPDFTDLGSNTAGALLGWAAARAWTARWEGPLLRPISWIVLLRVGAFSLLGLIAVQSLLNPGGDLSSWERYPILLGNEASGDRPWVGEIEELAVYDRALGHSGLFDAVERRSLLPGAWRDGGPILWLRFAGTPRGHLDGPAGATPYLPSGLAVQADAGSSSARSGQSGLAFASPVVRLDDRASDHVLERLRAADAFTVDLRLRSGSGAQHGPARIVTMSNGTRERNLMVGQVGSNLAIRIRTPGSGPNAGFRELRTAGGVLNGEMQHVRVSYDGQEALVYVDRSCKLEAHVGVNRARLLLGHLLGVTIVACTAGMALAVFSLCAGGVRERALRGLAAGLGAWALLWLVGTWEHVAGFDAPAAGLGVAGLAAAAFLLSHVEQATRRSRAAA